MTTTTATAATMCEDRCTERRGERQRSHRHDGRKSLECRTHDPSPPLVCTACYRSHLALRMLRRLRLPVRLEFVDRTTQIPQATGILSRA
jgi:hypothetical protein